jgi:hypothetical protein
MGFLFFSRVGKSIATFSLFESSPREILATVGTFDGCIRDCWKTQVCHSCQAVSVTAVGGSRDAALTT